MLIKRVAIHPAIGIMRVGNSREGYFVGPEVPGAIVRPDGGFKDDDGTSSSVKRQAARFRVFAFDEGDRLLGELTAADARISWTVELANKKAEWDRFQGTTGEQLPLDARRPGAARNPDITGDNRAQLEITPSPVTLAGPEQHASLDDGFFFDAPVKLGDVLDLERRGRQRNNGA